MPCSAALRVRPNWLATFPIAPGQCLDVRVPPGPTLLTVFPVARPYRWLRHAAARVDVPPTGAVARYREVEVNCDEGWIDDETEAIGLPRHGQLVCAAAAFLGHIDCPVRAWAVRDFARAPTGLLDRCPIDPPGP